MILFHEKSINLIEIKYLFIDNYWKINKLKNTFIKHFLNKFNRDLLRK